MPLRFAGSSSSSAMETEKHVAGSGTYDGYVSSMRGRSSLKADYFRTTLLDVLAKSENPLVLDIGTGNGSLLNQVRPQVHGQRPDVRFVGFDLSLPMLQYAKQAGLENAVVSDAFNMPVADGAVDAVMLSSVFHELYSYSSPAFDRATLVETMTRLGGMLKPGGSMVIRDPARPEKPDEPMLVTPVRDNGSNPRSEKQLLAELPERLSTESLMRRFLLEFQPAQGVYEQVDKHTFRMPAWLVSEFIQHRPFSRTIEDWNSEIKEQYGVLNKSEMRAFAKQSGFQLPLLRTDSEVEHRSRAFRGELDVRTAKGKPVDFEKRFPITFYAVLRKPR